MAAVMRGRALLMRNALAWWDVRVVVGLFCVAQLLDGITTYIALSSHRFTEQNPLLGSILDAHPMGAVALKLLVAAVVVVTVLALRLRWRLRLAVITLFTALSLVAPAVNLARLAQGG
ncbi:MAG TPA: DUF5658 family protein [Candidatus Binatia bacterium]|nr:DUF5658 family protein [Candidatus Binatia bacterium]